MYSISPNLNYLVTGITIYGKQNKKAEIDLYTAKYDENGVFINYTNAEDKKLDDIATIEYAESGNVIIRKLLHDKTCFYYQKVINWNAIKATTAKQLSDSLEEKWNGITKEEEKLLYNADTSCTVINSIVSLIEKDKEEACTSTKQIEDNKAVKVFFEQPSYTVDELLEFIVDKAICLESLKTAPYQKLKEAFVKVGSQASIKDKKEITLLRLIAAIKSSDYSDFIETLEGKDKKNTLLFNILKNVDDATLGFYGGNHFTSFIGSLVHIYEKNSDLWINRMQNIEDGRLFGQVISLDPVKYTVSKDVGFFNNNIYEFGEARFRGKLRADQKIQISREKGYVLQNGSSNWLPDNDYPSISLAPLDPVTILTKENIDLVKESLQGTTRTLEGKYVVPALFLEYQTDKEFKKATADGLMNTLDVITIATGGAGLATKIGWIPRIWALAEIAGAGGNLLVNNTDITKNSPKTTAVINSYNFVMGVIGVKNMVVGIKNIVPNLKTGVKNAVKEGKDLTNVEDLAKATDDFKKELSALKNSSEWNHLDTKVKQQILKQEEFVDIFVKEKVIVTDAIRKSWNGARNIFEATAEEIAEATTKIKNHRISTGNLKGGNYGYLDGSVNGKSIENKMWRSGNVIEGEPQIFEAMKVSRNSGNTWLRNTDSEYKMLNKLADDLGGVSGGKYPNVIGELKIISENPYCASCTGIIQQFNEMYPNVKLILIDGAK